MDYVFISVISYNLQGYQKVRPILVCANKNNDDKALLSARYCFWFFTCIPDTTILEG